MKLPLVFSTICALWLLPLIVWSQPGAHIDSQQAREELDFSFNYLQSYYPNFGLSFSSEELRHSFEDAKAQYGDAPVELRDHFARIRRLMALLGDGHACAEPPLPNRSNALHLSHVFPLWVYGIGERGFAYRDFNGIVRGSEILEIDGTSFSRISEVIAPLVCKDTVVNPLTGITLVSYFHLLYWLAFGEKDAFEVKYRTPEGYVYSTRLEAEPLVYVVEEQRRVLGDPEPLETFWISGVPVLRVNSFLGEKEEFERFFDRFFNELRTSQTQDLIIDLRENKGGHTKNASLLLAYLLSVRHHLPRYLHVSGKTLDPATWLSPLPYSNRSLQELLSANNEVIRSIASFRARKAEKPQGWSVKTKSLAWGKKEYLGRVHVLLSSRTYSAASLFADELRRKNRATFYGETPGGSSSLGCNSAPFYTVLYHSRIRLSVPLACYMTERTREKKLFVPDQIIAENPSDFLNRSDSLLDAVLNGIENEGG